jgi:hypothetical protein
MPSRIAGDFFPAPTECPAYDGRRPARQRPQRNGDVSDCRGVHAGLQGVDLFDIVGKELDRSAVIDYVYVAEFEQCQIDSISAPVMHGPDEVLQLDVRIAVDANAKVRE